VLVSGGSLGAVAVNELAAQALILLAKDHRLQITHQTGEKDLEVTAKRYRDAGVEAAEGGDADAVGTADAADAAPGN